MTATIRDKRAKLDQILKSLKVPAVVLKVGIFSDAGEEPGGLTVAEVATYHEFGYGVPERSFLRGYLDENAELVLDTMNTQLGQVVDGTRSIKVAANRIGLLIVGGIKERISNRIAPALAESTLKIKGEDKDVPLIYSGQLRNSIVHKVEK